MCRFFGLRGHAGKKSFVWAFRPAPRQIHTAIQANRCCYLNRRQPRKYNLKRTLKTKSGERSGAISADPFECPPVLVGSKNKTRPSRHQDQYAQDVERCPSAGCGLCPTTESFYETQPRWRSDFAKRHGALPIAGTKLLGCIKRKGRPYSIGISLHSLKRLETSNSG